MSIGARIKLARNSRGMKVADLAKRVGLAGSTIYDLERGDSTGTGKLHKFAKALDVRLEWLEHGLGPMRAESQSMLPGIGDLDDPNEYVTKVRGAKAAAGSGHIAFEHEEVDGSHAFKRSWLRQKGIHSITRCRMVEVEGDSMSPYLEHGDIVLVNMDDTTVRDGQVYVVALDGELLVKRLFKQIDGGVELRSDNPAPRYAARHVAGEQLELLRILGRVVWRGG